MNFNEFYRKFVFKAILQEDCFGIICLTKFTLYILKLDDIRVAMMEL